MEFMRGHLNNLEVFQRREKVKGVNMKLSKMENILTLLVYQTNLVY